MGSQAYLKAAGKPTGLTPEEYEAMAMDATIPEDELNASFPMPWGFLVGWWVWGISYLFDINGKFEFSATPFGIIACVVSFAVSFIASIPMADAVKNRLPDKKKMLSLGFLIGWILLGIMSSLDVTDQLKDAGHEGKDLIGVWILLMLGPITVILSQKTLFEYRKMGTLWESP